MPESSRLRSAKKLRRAKFTLAACALGLLASQAPAATLSWDPGHTFGAGSGGTGTWDLTNSNWADTATTDRPWTDTSAAGTDTAVFAGTAGTVNLAANLSASQVVFNTTDYTVTGTNTLTLGADDANNNLVGFSARVTSGTVTIAAPVVITQTQYWTTGTGSTLSVTSALSGNFTLLLAGGGNYSLTGGTAAVPSTVGGLYPISGATTTIGGYLNTTGTFDVNGGTTANWSAVGNLNTTPGNGLFIVGDNTSGTMNVTGGTITATPGAFVVGNGGNGAAVGTLNISGGAVTMGNNQQVFIGSGYQGDIANSTGVLTVSGTGLFTTGATTGAFILGPTGTSTVGAGTVNLDGGTLATGRSITLGASTGATGTFNFNGGTLQATAGNASFMQGLTTANVRGNGATANSGAVIDTQTFNVTVGQALLHSTIAGDAATDGGLTKLGSGILTLTGANTYTGTTTVSGGTLALTTGSINASALVQVTAGALTLGTAAALSDVGVLSLASGTSLDLGAGAGTSEVIGRLLLTNGTPAPSGTYTAAALSSLDPGVTFNSDNGETLTIAAVPEPSAFVGGLLLLGALVGFRGVRCIRARG